MQTQPVYARLARLEPAVTDHGDLLQVTREGERVVIATGARAVNRARLLARIVGALVAVAGLALTPLAIWYLALTPLGCLIALVVPGRLNSARLLEIDNEQGAVIACETGAQIPLAAITSIRGAYETQGWDPRSVLYAVHGADETAAIILRGTDETLAETACRTLGVLLNPFGEMKTCYNPLIDTP
jgi:hypothetical protein